MLCINNARQIYETPEKMMKTKVDLEILKWQCATKVSDPMSKWRELKKFENIAQQKFETPIPKSEIGGDFAKKLKKRE